MVKLIGPLHSLDARGRLGTDVIFSRNRRTSYAKAYAIPSNPKTLAQRLVRIGTGGIAKAWSKLTPITKASWSDLAIELDLSPYHAHLATNCRLWRDQLPLWMSPTPQTAGGISLAGTNKSLAGNVYTLTAAWYHNSNQPIGLCQVCASVAYSFTPTRANTVLLLPWTTEGGYFAEYVLQWTRPYTALWYFKARALRRDHTWTTWETIS